MDFLASAPQPDPDNTQRRARQQSTHTLRRTASDDGPAHPSRDAPMDHATDARIPADTTSDHHPGVHDNHESVRPQSVAASDTRLRSSIHSDPTGLRRRRHLRRDSHPTPSPTTVTPDTASAPEPSRDETDDPHTDTSFASIVSAVVASVRTTVSSIRSVKLSNRQTYCLVSAFLAFLAVVAAPIGTAHPVVSTLFATDVNSVGAASSSFLSSTTASQIPQIVIAQSAWLGQQTQSPSDQHKTSRTTRGSMESLLAFIFGHDRNNNVGVSTHQQSNSQADEQQTELHPQRTGWKRFLPPFTNSPANKQRDAELASIVPPSDTHTSDESDVANRPTFPFSWSLQQAGAQGPSDTSATTGDVVSKGRPNDGKRYTLPRFKLFVLPRMRKISPFAWVDPCILAWLKAGRNGNGSNHSSSQPELAPTDGFKFHTVLALLTIKVISSVPRMMLVVHCMLAWAFVGHLAVASWFLRRRQAAGPLQISASSRERISGFLVFKLLLTFAILVPAGTTTIPAEQPIHENMDWLAILMWYTWISCLRSWTILTAEATSRMQQTQSDNATTSGAPAVPTNDTGGGRIRNDGTSVNTEASMSWYHSASSIPSHGGTDSITNGVLGLLGCILVCNAVAAATCIALVVPNRGWKMAIWLCGECLLLATEVLEQALQHVRTVWEMQQSQQISLLEDEQLRLHSAGDQRPIMPDPQGEHFQSDNASTTDIIEEQSWKLDQRMELLEVTHARRVQWMETMLFGCQLVEHIFACMHFLHIWSIHGVQWTLIDGVLALHVHSAITGALQQISQWQHIRAMATAIQRLFRTATADDLDQHVGDVCCICLGSMMAQGRTIKVLPRCGHLVHATCLRQVVERASSLETAKCPLCRSKLYHPNAMKDTSIATTNVTTVDMTATGTGGVAVAGATIPTDNDGGGAVPERGVGNTIATGTVEENVIRDQALFRLSTEGILPAWIPIPSFSFEVIRRSAQTPVANVNDPDIRNNNNNNSDGTNAQQVPPAVEPPQSFLRRMLTYTTTALQNAAAGTMPLSPEQEALAMEQLVDMFPQHNRHDLLQSLRRRGSPEAVVEAVLLGRIPAAVGG